MVKAVDLIGSNSQFQNHWIRRIIAAIIDFVIIVILWVILGAIFTIMAFFIPTGLIILPIIWGITWLIYVGFLEGTTGATIGKRMLNLEVISLEGPMNLGKGFIRNITKIHSLIFLIDWLVGFVTDGDPRQRFMDRIANTTVVRTDVQEIFAGAFQPPGGPIPAPVVPSGPGAPQYTGPPSHPQQGGPTQHEAELQTSARPAYETPDSGSSSYESPVTPVADQTRGKTFTRSELVNMKKDELSKIAREKDLKVSGTKRDLIDRILGEEI
jgi:uncharacterized RDD family membrane protein YckC